MDNNINNNGVLNTAMPNDNSSNVNSTPDFNSIQPQATPVQDNSSNPPNSGLNVMGDNPTDSFYQDPTSFENPKDNLTQQAPAQESFTPVTDMNMPQANTEPVVQQPTAVEETRSPISDIGMAQAPITNDTASQMPNIGNVEPTIEQNPVQQESTSPVVDMSMPQPNVEPVVEQTPIQEPTVDQSVFNSTMPQESIPTAQENSNMGMSEMGQAPVGQETPVVGQEPTVAQDTQPAFPNLSEPLTSPSTSTEMSEEMNTLQESKPEEKDSNVVIIVLILIIVLLLAGIGYFGYQIFLA